MEKFTQCLGLSSHVLASLERMQFNTPTPIQAQTIPLILAGRDILGSAQTGTGKTGAFVIPMVSKLLNNEIQGALILAPTRELAAQVVAFIELLLGKNSGINVALLIGGEDIRRQLQQLRKQPRIIVGTPGRINDHIERGTVQLSKVGYVVLDETDRMLDMGFGQQIESIIEQVAQQRQTLMFSATMPNNIARLSSKYLQNPERVAIGSCLQPIAAIAQETVKLNEDQKYDHLVKVLTDKEGSVVVFVKTKFGAKKLADKLYRDRFQAQAIHGNLRQNKRDQVITGFKNKKFRILVATDVAARGLDVPHIQLVVNHDLPQCPEDYIHRIGRTARAGATGSAINFITNSDNRLWRAIERFMNTGEGGNAGNGGGDRQGGRNNGGGRSSGPRRFDRGPRRFGKNGSGNRFRGNNRRDDDGQGDDYAPRPERSNRFEFAREQGSFTEGGDQPRAERSERSERSGGRFESQGGNGNRRSSGGTGGRRRFFNKNRSSRFGSSAEASSR
ncbi:DEAD/DEAH box helicase [Candidatus Babeliales bacterium]|nr:DEAD/DEAH box helicase [Candidatus Babeliales bacterium]